MKILSLNIRGLGLDDNKKFRWFKKVCLQQKPNIIALQETKAEKIWGSCDYKYAFKKSKGNSGGILTVWDPNIFVTNRVVERDSFIAVKGYWKDVGTELILVNTYGPQNDTKKKQMWSDLSDILRYSDAIWAIFGDFNEVRFNFERKNTKFCERRAKVFNDFIKDNSLLDLPLGGRTYTRISDNGRKFIKLDRFLVSENFLQQWTNANVLVLDKKHTDHCPLILKDGDINFGPKPVKVFDEWLNHKESHNVSNSAWKVHVNSNRPDVIFREKLKKNETRA
ncbi:uncharacterized protein [Rutidosis leptorrhynchoides]|uniref:uncharacterized protein n=1 Tax=Rutidosis leptorrhynchoides TaxID=125765 RepID=UPI003A99587E